MVKPPKESHRQWDEKRFCSRQCGAVNRVRRGDIPFMKVGHPVSEKHREKLRNLMRGNTHWTKIKTPYVMTENRRQQITRCLRGRTPWNTGKKYVLAKRPGTGMKGPKNPRWISDRSKLSRVGEYRNSPAHRDWSRSVKNRDCWKCRISNGDCSGPVVAHHILPWATFPELRYEITNGITLCHSHHPRKRDDEMRLSPLFQEMVGVTTYHFGKQ